MTPRSWRSLWWTLLAFWIACALLDMAHIGVWWVTSYGADLTIPAWLYISARSLDDPSRNSLLRRTLGQSRWMAAIAIVSASTATEISQFFFPRGPFSGVFDVMDIVAYASGVAVCFVLDRPVEQADGRA